MGELDALKDIDTAFSSLDEAAQSRTIQWLIAKYGLKPGSPQANPPSAKSAAALSMTAKAVATAFNVQSGPDLLYAAAAFLGVVQNMETFSRQLLLDTMKTATGFYKPTYNNNLSAYLDGLCKKGVLIEVSTQTFAIKAGTLAQMTERLAAAA